ncbi:malonyl-CoA decarboxylase [Paralcaligenes ureilyticus]|uniref:Malonyl-CoA decarboxylase n=1 Tax=Paralcaligenes ureilyticus TaxID=627131 RepID=A0A4R3MBS9_9BURK|nr:malonyl-CoA decarboxylase [Paralcaligenes ureilyticus]
MGGTELITQPDSHTGESAPSLPEHTLEKNREPTHGLIARLGRWLERDRLPAPVETQTLFAARLTDVAANRLARQWSTRYTTADDAERRFLLAELAQTSAGIEPRDDLGVRLFKRLNAQTDGLRFLVGLRADMLRWRKQIAGLTLLERELEGLLSNWFDVGMLELKPINWDSPASLLEKLIQYEAVHEIHSWDELRRRVAKDRRCYAFFHPGMDDVPLIFVEVAFAPKMADNVQVLLDMQTPPDDLSKARWAIFYSISSTQAGLRGISFGNFLLKRVIDELLSELPNLKSFATLSPIPGFAAWLGKQDGKVLQELLHDRTDNQYAQDSVRSGLRWVAQLQKAAVGDASDVVQRAGLKLAAHYLTSIKSGQLIDPVARFHLGNGARIERINWAADCSPKGLQQSCAMMVNYLYSLDELDENLLQLAAGKPRIARHLRWR